MMFDDTHVGRRVAYTDRKGDIRHATVKEVLSSVKQLNINIDGMTRERYYVPFDMCKLLDDTE